MKNLVNCIVTAALLSAASCASVDRGQQQEPDVDAGTEITPPDAPPIVTPPDAPPPCDAGTPDGGCGSGSGSGCCCPCAGIHW